MFNISPKIDDLTHTSLTLTVYDHEAIRSDEIIGQVGHMMKIIKITLSHNQGHIVPNLAGVVTCKVLEPK